MRRKCSVCVRAEGVRRDSGADDGTGAGEDFI